MIEAFYKIGELFLGEKFLQGNTFIDFVRDGFRLALLVFSPIVLLVIGATIISLVEILVNIFI